MNARGTILALFLFISGAGSSSRANVTFNFMSRGNPVGSDGTTITGYRGFTLHLHSDSGNIAAVDFSGPFGFSGRFVQRWVDDYGFDDATPMATQQNLTNSDVK